MKVVWTATALRHLRGVPRVVGEEILQKLELATRFPRMYTERGRGRYRGCRWFPVGPWLTFYRIKSQAIVVCGVWHGARYDA